jgi:hypothetical protein
MLSATKIYLGKKKYLLHLRHLYSFIGNSLRKNGLRTLPTSPPHFMQLYRNLFVALLKASFPISIRSLPYLQKILRPSSTSPQAERKIAKVITAKGGNYFSVYASFQ